ncbi:MAG TPA: LLM class flavin-dependent oxidoreductase [Baekduia sp.]|uniref:LLM class flavin-dependent oxidoreductase n=1 Tax=Baekduia sp. TaxID=2600305 RepID=UPI002D7A29DA|nr:LLM class flavin-dependent oxidoreductase [Baekduia sp.]HET6507976.1 LLM class flavin-dependent oxidoreductase [Baekduia sp.]
MGRPLRFAVGLPNVRAYGDPRALVRLGELAERSGWDGVFVWDNLAVRDGQAPYPVADPWAVMAALAVTTRSVRLGVMVTVLPRRLPAEVARQSVTVDVLSGGRLIFGAGLGSHAEDEFACFGQDPDPVVRGEKLDEALDVLVGLWTGERCTVQGRWFTVRDQTFLPTSPQQPRMPVWIAGRWPSRRPFRRAARWDGVFPAYGAYGTATAMPPEVLAEIVAFVRRHRDPALGPVDVVLEGETAGTDPVREAERIQRYREAGLTWWVEKLGWFRGDLDLVERRIAAGPPRTRAAA